MTKIRSVTLEGAYGIYIDRRTKTQNNDTLITIDFYANRKSILNLPDGPRTPLWLETLQFVLHPVEYLEARHKSYGDAFTLGKNTDSPVVYLSHPDALKEIFTANPSSLNTGSANKPLLQPVLGDYSVALLDGELHQRQRRLLVPPLHGERMKTYGQLICDITQQIIDRWKIGETVLVRSAMQEITLTVMVQAIFGLHTGERYELVRKLIGLFIDSIGSPLTASMLFFPALRQNFGSVSPWGRFVRLRQQIDRVLYSEINRRRQQLNSSDPDILTLLLMARDEDGQQLTDVEIRDQLVTLLITGYETTATALTWALYWVDYLPEVNRQIESEIGNFDPNEDPSGLARLPYLNAFCCETLRIYPVVLATSPRMVQEPLQIGTYEFSPGTILMPCIYLTHQREDIYPASKQFQPERFLERQFSPYEYLPFGGGNRSCIGMALAMFEMKLVLATILRKKQLMRADRKPLKPVRRSLTVAPPDNFQMVVTAERQLHKALAVL